LDVDLKPESDCLPSGVACFSVRKSSGMLMGVILKNPKHDCCSGSSIILFSNRESKIGEDFRKTGGKVFHRNQNEQWFVSLAPIEITSKFRKIFTRGN
jgi:hypothetical protein